MRIDLSCIHEFQVAFHLSRPGGQELAFILSIRRQVRIADLDIDKQGILPQHRPLYGHGIRGIFDSNFFLQDVGNGIRICVDPVSRDNAEVAQDDVSACAEYCGDEQQDQCQRQVAPQLSDRTLVAFLYRLVRQVHGIRNLTDGHAVIIFHTDQVELLRVKGCHGILKIQLLCQTVFLRYCIRNIVTVISRGKAAGGIRHMGGAGSALPVAADRLVARDGNEKRGVRAFRRIIWAVPCIKSKEHVIDALFDIFRIIQIIGNGFPDKSSVLLDQCLRGGEDRRSVFVFERISGSGHKLPPYIR